MGQKETSRRQNKKYCKEFVAEINAICRDRVVNNYFLFEIFKFKIFKPN
jgi:hypothetical protein